MNTIDFSKKMNEDLKKNVLHVSQGTQYLVLEYIFKNIKCINTPPIAVEFGVIDIDKGNNINSLIKNMGFKGIFFDGNNENKERNLYKEWITSENICSIFSKYNIPNKPEVVSIDIDSCDLWVMDAILKKYKPIVVTIEYNGSFPKEYAITMKNINTGFYYGGQRAFGTSPRAIKLVGEKYNYSIVYIRLDVFLIHNDYLKNINIPNFDTDFIDSDSNAAGYRSMFHQPCLPGREKILIDYKKLIETNDMVQAEKSAKNIVKQYCSYKPLKNHNILLNNHDQRRNFNEITDNYYKEVCAKMLLYNKDKKLLHASDIYDLNNIDYSFNIEGNSQIIIKFLLNQYYIEYNYYYNLWENNNFTLNGLFMGVDSSDIDIIMCSDNKSIIVVNPYLFRNIQLLKDVVVCELISKCENLNKKYFVSIGISYLISHTLNEKETYTIKFKMKADSKNTFGKFPKIYTGIKWITLEDSLTNEWKIFNLTSNFNSCTKSMFRIGLYNADFGDKFSLQLLEFKTNQENPINILEYNSINLLKSNHKIDYIKELPIKINNSFNINVDLDLMGINRFSKLPILKHNYGLELIIKNKSNFSKKLTLQNFQINKI